MAVELECTARDSPRASARASVVIAAGNGKLWMLAITGSSVAIGRDPACELVVRHAAISRRHAVIRVGPPLTVQDLGSTNGTRVARTLHVGGAPVPLELGESFHVGPFSFTVLDGCPPASVTGSRGAIRITDPTPARAPEVVRNVARSQASVLILGETGVGKEVLAQTVHELSGRPGPLVRINCAALSESLLESELFGHEKGAFTSAIKSKPGLLEAAHRGTALLDEIAELSTGLQAKLLRALETREVTRVGAVAPIAIDVRFIAATHRDLATEIASQRFRADLYYRLDGVSFVIPPLRERRGMIAPLALQFVAAALPGRDRARSVSAAFLDKLEAHDWPGNVRELKATIERAVILAAGGDLSASHLMFSPRFAAPDAPPSPDAPSRPTPDRADDAATDERAAILAALAECAGNQTRAATRLGISRATLTNKLARYRIPRPRGRSRSTK